jgi:hypothetical protein
MGNARATAQRQSEMKRRKLGNDIFRSRIYSDGEEPYKDEGPLVFLASPRANESPFTNRYAECHCASFAHAVAEA